MHRKEEESSAHLKKTEAFQAASVEKLYVARNTAYGFWQQQKVFAYHKRGEVGEVQADDETIFANGGEPKFWLCDKLTYGIEICKDSADGYIKNVTKQEVDVQIVLSASLGTKEITPVYKHCLIHAAQVAAESCVITKAGGNIKPEKPTKNPFGFPLRFYKVNLPD